MNCPECTTVMTGYANSVGVFYYECPCGYTGTEDDIVNDLHDKQRARYLPLGTSNPPSVPQPACPHCATTMARIDGTPDVLLCPNCYHLRPVNTQKCSHCHTTTTHIDIKPGNCPHCHNPLTSTNPDQATKPGIRTRGKTIRQITADPEIRRIVDAKNESARADHQMRMWQGRYGPTKGQLRQLELENDQVSALLGETFDDPDGLRERYDFEAPPDRRDAVDAIFDQVETDDQEWRHAARWPGKKELREAHALGYVDGTVDLPVRYPLPPSISSTVGKVYITPPGAPDAHTIPLGTVVPGSFVFVDDAAEREKKRRDAMIQEVMLGLDVPSRIADAIVGKPISEEQAKRMLGYQEDDTKKDAEADAALARLRALGDDMQGDTEEPA